MKNTMTDLNNILFEQLERINDDDLHGDELKEALNKAEAINNIASTIINSANTQVRAAAVFGNKVITDTTSNLLGIGG